MPPDTECPMLPTALESPELPPLPSLLPPDCTPEPEDTLLTLLVLSMLPRGPLMLSQRPMPTTVTTDTELFPMLDMVTAPTDHTVWLTVMAEASTTKSLPKESRTRENSRFIQRLLS